MAVGHAFVLQVADARMTIYDDNIKRSLRSYGEWIDRLMFVLSDAEFVSFYLFLNKMVTDVNMF
ncbi:hypothetical protein F442_01402 [Phytophthora nicotianae P10297]|uniref:Uncharacterized protein n=2 Tax=Phytophthora nicotianae TaxID=4792 RepID=V9FWQ2_PHYNI|nr:hypothetical protein F443_01450 [Phytophthora nicotianae P1569]ETP53717.1 hypothetical protein F442_01402 [Phytophthora nicotianae P10297]